MKNFAIFLILFSCFYLTAIEVSGNQSGTWNSVDNPFEMIGDVVVPDGEMLQIEPGVELIAMGNYKITALGNVLAIGTEEDSIRFYGSNGLDWGGLRFENESLQSELFYCRISNTDDTNDYGIHSINSPIFIHYCFIDDHQKGVSFSGLSSSNPSYMEIRHTRISNVEKSGITVVDNSNVLIDSCEVTQCGLGSQFFGAIQLSLQSNDHNCSPTISNNHIHHNGKQGITMANLFNYNFMNPTITGNIVEYNLTGMYFYSAQGMVDNNIIRNNFIPGDANSGAGVMLYGSSADGYFTNNEINGNFTGFYLTAGATANIGNVYNGSDLDDGYNYIHDNVDESGNVYSIYNASDAEVLAQNNLWDSADPLEIAETIIDVNDIGSYGEVIFEPLYIYTIPPAPENLYIDFDGTGHLQLFWEFEEILGFDHFNIYSSYEFCFLSDRNREFELVGTSTIPEFTYYDMILGGQYDFYVTAINIHNIESDSSNVVGFYYVGSEEEEIPIIETSLSNFPNPFNPSTTIYLNFSNNLNEHKGISDIIIYNLKGQKVKSLPISSSQLPSPSVTWDGTDEDGNQVGSGIYFARLNVGERVMQKKMMLIK
ncbi:right-handed parallel beta-helix repeat-containing protein [Candidatus Cloacimonadota bacterium]